MQRLTDITGKSESIDFYKKLLNDFVINNRESQPIGNSDWDEYISAFSLYMYCCNDAYKYNLPYLGHQHEKFKAFLTSASAKCELLRSIVVAIKSSAVTQLFITERPAELETVKICLNDFLASDLNGTISFHEAFSFSGAERNPRNDVLTILYNKQVRSCKVATKISSDGKNAYAPIVKMAEDIWGMNKRTGGTAEDGDA